MGVASAGATAEWKAEGVQAADGSPTLASASIPVFLADVDVVYSYEVGDDAVSFINELSRIIVDAVDGLVSTAYTTGGGSTAPQGIITGLAGTCSEINGGGSEVLAVGDPLLLQNALPPRFSARAQWCANIAIINSLGAFETTNGALRFLRSRDGCSVSLSTRCPTWTKHQRCRHSKQLRFGLRRFPGRLCHR